MRVVLLEMEETSKRSSDRTKHPIDTKVVPLDSARGDLSNDTSLDPVRGGGERCTLSSRFQSTQNLMLHLMRIGTHGPKSSEVTRTTMRS